MNKITLLTAILLLTMVLTTKSQTYSGGTGISTDPYQIANLVDLQYLSEHNTDWIMHFVQTADIDARETRSWNVGDHDNNVSTPDVAMGFSPIGESFADGFTGSYNGQGHTIDSLYINRTSQNTGLFGVLLNGASIDSLGVTNVDITGSTVVGGLVGVSQNTCAINNSFSTGNVNGNGNYIGGFAGRNYNATITNCYSLANVNSTSNYVGGFTGYNTGSIDKCYSIGSVVGNSAIFNPQIGGFVGSDNSGEGTATNSFYNIELSGQTTSAGGTGLNTVKMQSMDVYADSTWDFMVEDANGTDNIWGLNTDENGGYPFLAWQGFSHTVSSCGYIIPQGEGTEVSPYQIATLCDLKWLSNASSALDKHFVQTADIDARETRSWNLGDHDNNVSTPDVAMGFSPIGESFADGFTGSYNGQGHTIDSLYINRTSQNTGLFGVLFNGASIDSLGVTNVDITGETVVGGLVGVSQNTCVINNSFSTGNVNGSGTYIGGFAGRNYKSTINNCYSFANVNSTSNYVGGFTGYNTGSIDKCYSIGSVVGNSAIFNPQIGGLVGSDNSGEGTATNSFYNIELSGQTTSAGGTGLNTVKMQSLCRYIDAGWDFMLETVNGNNDIWGMNESENNAFPFLSWQNYAHTITFIDNIIPTITCLEDTTIILEQGETDYTVQGTELDPTATDDNCNVASLINNFNNLESLAEAVLPTGTTTIIWTVTDDAGNDNTCAYDVIVNLYVGIESVNNEKISFTIYPNPAKEQITVNYSLQNVENLQLLDIVGRVVRQISLKQNSTIIDISNLNRGVYFIKVDNEVVKFVKE